MDSFILFYSSFIFLAANAHEGAAQEGLLAYFTVDGWIENFTTERSNSRDCHQLYALFEKLSQEHYWLSISSCVSVVVVTLYVGAPKLRSFFWRILSPVCWKCPNILRKMEEFEDKKALLTGECSDLRAREKERMVEVAILKEQVENLEGEKKALQLQLREAWNSKESRNSACQTMTFPSEDISCQTVTFPTEDISCDTINFPTEEISCQTLSLTILNQIAETTQVPQSREDAGIQTSDEDIFTYLAESERHLKDDLMSEKKKRRALRIESDTLRLKLELREKDVVSYENRSSETRQVMEQRMERLMGELDEVSSRYQDVKLELEWANQRLQEEKAYALCLQQKTKWMGKRYEKIITYLQKVITNLSKKHLIEDPTSKGPYNSKEHMLLPSHRRLLSHYAPKEARAKKKLKTNLFHGPDIYQPFLLRYSVDKNNKSEAQISCEFDDKIIHDFARRDAFSRKEMESSPAHYVEHLAEVFNNSMESLLGGEIERIRCSTKEEGRKDIASMEKLASERNQSAFNLGANPATEVPSLEPDPMAPSETLHGDVDGEGSSTLSCDSFRTLSVKTSNVGQNAFESKAQDSRPSLKRGNNGVENG